MIKACENCGHGKTAHESKIIEEFPSKWGTVSIPCKIDNCGCTEYKFNEYSRKATHQKTKSGPLKVEPITKDVCYQADSEHVTITIAEYEKLQGDSRRLRSICDYHTEFLMKRRLINSESVVPQLAVQMLRRVFINKISVVLSKDWNG